MGISRIAIIFDNTHRPETTGFYCRRALGCIAEVEHFLPNQLDQIQTGDFDLFLNIDDGLRYELPSHLRPAACWVIDTHIDFEWSLAKAKQFDVVFAAQKLGAEKLRQHGIETATWLPLACDPELHTAPRATNEFDVAFVGHVFPGLRQDLLNRINDRFDRVFVGNRYLIEMAKTYASSHIVFNRSVADDVNMRVFEGLASGSLLISNDLPDSGQNELFRNGQDFVTYRDEDELIERISYFLEHPNERERIARSGQILALSQHTYLHRMIQLLRLVESSQSPISIASPVDFSDQVSACLLSWKRPENLQQIVQNLRNNELVDDIVIWNNNPDFELTIDDDNTTVINSPQNVVTYGRYLATEHAKHDLIFTQDDDCLVHNFEQLYATFRLDPSRMAHNLKLGHLVANATNRVGNGAVGLLGWGAFFDRRWCSVLEQYTAKFGVDNLLHRKADRIFSLLLKRSHRPSVAEVTDLQGASEAEALSVMPDHFALTTEAVRRVTSIWNEPATMSDRRHLTEQHLNTYFEFSRPELVELVPLTARRVLDIGCGAGRLGESIKARQIAEVWGVELDAMAAEAARRRLDRVLNLDLEAELAELSGQQFDVIICGDVLEHLRDPRAFLKRCRDWLTPTGQIIASIPNVGHHSVVSSLLDGNWTYEPAGLLDDTHTRFFTRREVEKLFFRAGYEIQSLSWVAGDGYEQWKEARFPDEVQFGNLTLHGLTRERIEEFHAYQFLITATPQARIAGGRLKGIRELQSLYPWPRYKPPVPIPEEAGWLADGSREALAAVLTDHTKIVVELGAWLGLSTRYIADRAPNATIITIDHWKGSEEHQRKPEWNRLLPNLYETFLNLSWEFRDRIIPIRQRTLEGLRIVAEIGIQPDVVFFDADHAYEAVSADLQLARELFPKATFVGDDYDDPGVEQAVGELASRHKQVVSAYGTRWRAWHLPATDNVPESPLPADGLTSIIIVTHNHLTYTRGCLDSIRHVTDEPYELIVVDNASTDGTVQYLTGQADVKLVVNAENRGFPAAVNQGIEVATGEQILLLNNDTLLTTGWLQRMLDCLHSSESIGLVGPTSNAVSGEQQISVSYRRLESLDGFAWDLGKHNHRRYEETDRLVGFCLLIDRKVISAIGTLDEQFGIGNFEDDDYCRRAIAAGFRCMIARDSYVHHFGSVTFRASGEDFAEILKENHAKYQDKWRQQNVDGDEKVELTTESMPSPEDLDPNIKLSLCMIVRDNERTIRPCLESIRPWVDEIIIVDTGSIDRTPEICREFGAQIFEFPWIDDFSAARNESLKHARGEWVFWMDSDDTIPESCGRGLRDLVHVQHAEQVGGFIIQVHCLHESDSQLTVVDHVKLFRNGIGVHFELPIHEQVIPSIRARNRVIEFTELYIEHHGSDPTPELRAQKLKRDFRILHKWERREPDHEFLLFNLGMTHDNVGNNEEAVDYLQRCIARSIPEHSHLRKAYAILASSLTQLGRTEESRHVCETGLKLFAADKELLFRLGIAQSANQDFEAAVETYRQVLNESEHRHLTSIDPGICGFKTRHNLAVALDALGRHDEALAEWSMVLAEHSQFAPAIFGTTETLIETGRVQDAQEQFSARIERPSLPIDYWLNVRILYAQNAQKQESLALEYLKRGREKYPDSIELLQLECRVLIESQGPAAAIESLKELTTHAGNGAVWHDLAMAELVCNNHDAAREAFEKSLQIRPYSPNTWLEYEKMLLDLGRVHDADLVRKRASDACEGQRNEVHADGRPPESGGGGFQHSPNR